MFDIGFAEILIIGVVSLLVIGPDRLPETIRTAALWFGRLKRALGNFRSEFEQQIGADEIRRELHNENIMAELKKIEEDVGGLKESFDPGINTSNNPDTAKTSQPQQVPLSKTENKAGSAAGAKKDAKTSSKPKSKPKIRQKTGPASHE